MAVAIVVVAALSTFDDATADGIIGDLPAEGVALALWDGGSVYGLAESNPEVASVWVTARGSLVGFLIFAPSFVNEDFESLFPSGEVPAGTPMLVVVSGGSSPPVAGPAPTPTPSPTPSATPAPVATPTPSMPASSIPLATSFVAWVTNAAQSGFSDQSGVPLVPSVQACDLGAEHLGWGVSNGTAITIVGEGTGACSGWWLADSLGEQFFIANLFVTLTAASAPPGAPPAAGESVTILAEFGLSEVLVQRSTGELWLLDYFGCFRLGLMEGRSVFITPGAGGFGTFGSEIINSSYDETCTVLGGDNRLEWVTTSPVAGSFGNEVVATRSNGEVWLLDYGVGCLSIGIGPKTVLVHSGGAFFAGIGSEIIVPDRSQSCRIWSAERL